MNLCYISYLSIASISICSCHDSSKGDISHIELITNPEVRCVLLTKVDSLSTLLKPSYCPHSVDCSMGYHSADTTFAVGFTLDKLTEQISAAQILQRDVRSLQLEQGDELAIEVICDDKKCSGYVYGYYELRTSMGPTTFFFGEVVLQGYSVGVYCQKTDANKREFINDGLELLRGIRIEPNS